MPHLAPPTLTTAEQKAILRATATNLRDHTIFSMALGTGLRLAELVGLNVGDVFTPEGAPRVRVRIRTEIAKGGREVPQALRLLSAYAVAGWMSHDEAAEWRSRLLALRACHSLDPRRPSD